MARIPLLVLLVACAAVAGCGDASPAKVPARYEVSVDPTVRSAAASAGVNPAAIAIRALDRADAALPARRRPVTVAITYDPLEAARKGGLQATTAPDGSITVALDTAQTSWAKSLLRFLPGTLVHEAHHSARALLG